MPSREDRVCEDSEESRTDPTQLLIIASIKQQQRNCDYNNLDYSEGTNFGQLENNSETPTDSSHSLTLRLAAHNNSGLATVLENVPLYSASGPTCRFPASYRSIFDSNDDRAEFICVSDGLTDAMPELSNDSDLGLDEYLESTNNDVTNATPNCSIYLSDQLDCCPVSESTSSSDSNSSRCGVLNWPSPRSFHKTHARHYSYDVAHCGKPVSHIVIGGSLVGVSGSAYCPSAVVLGDRLNRTNSLTRTDGSSLSSSFSVSSLSFSDYSASLASINNDLGEDLQTNPNSKQSSLDRRSFVSTEAQWAEFMLEEQREKASLEENFVTAKLKNGLSNILSK